LTHVWTRIGGLDAGRARSNRWQIGQKGGLNRGAPSKTYQEGNKGEQELPTPKPRLRGGGATKSGVKGPRQPGNEEKRKRLCQNFQGGEGGTTGQEKREKRARGYSIIFCWAGRRREGLDTKATKPGNSFN